MSLKSLHNVMPKAWFIFIQTVTIPANLLLTGLLKLTIERPEKFYVESGTLIIANHQSRIDPFLISYHVGIHNLKNVLPIRYPVTPDYMTKPFLGFCIRLLGGYNIGSTPLERLQKLVFTRGLLKEGYAVVLFPEGKINREHNTIDEFKKGASMLFNEDYPVVFVRLTGLNLKHKLHFWKNTNAKLTYSTYFDRSVPKEEKVQAMMHFFEMDTERPRKT